MKQIEKHVSLYTDYLIAVTVMQTAVRLPAALYEEINHDKFTRILMEGEFDSKYLWKKIKKSVRQIESENGYLIVDDTIVCRHFDHIKGKSVEDFNIINLLCYSHDVCISVGFQLSSNRSSL